MFNNKAGGMVPSRAARRVVLLLLCALLLPLQACWTVSANEIWDAEHKPVIDQRLLGTWVSTDTNCDDGHGTCKLHFDPPEKNANWDCYSMQQQNHLGKKTDLQGCLLQIGSWQFLDVTLSEAEDKRLPMTEALNAHLLEVHTLWKIENDETSLVLIPINDEWFSKQSKDDIGVPYVEVGEGSAMVDPQLLLTGKPNELRAFLLAHGGDQDLFRSKEDGFHWRRTH